MVAENKPAEAIEALRKGGANAWVDVGMIEAHTLTRKKKEAELTLASASACGGWLTIDGSRA